MKSREKCAHTWRAKAESVGGAQASSPNPGSEVHVLILGSELLLVRGHHQAHVGVELDQEPVLEHPDHHLDQLGLQREKQGLQHLGNERQEENNTQRVHLGGSRVTWRNASHPTQEFLSFPITKS